jgi:hypothetical protein
VISHSRPITIPVLPALATHTPDQHNPGAGGDEVEVWQRSVTRQRSAGMLCWARSPGGVGRVKSVAQHKAMARSLEWRNQKGSPSSPASPGHPRRSSPCVGADVDKHSRKAKQR